MKKNCLKVWIAIFFGMAIIAMHSFLSLVKGGDNGFLQLHFIILTFSFISYLAIYYLVLKDEFMKMQEQYKEMGSLKKLVQKWKGGD